MIHEKGTILVVADLTRNLCSTNPLVLLTMVEKHWKILWFLNALLITFEWVVTLVLSFSQAVYVPFFKDFQAHFPCLKFVWEISFENNLAKYFFQNFYLIPSTQKMNRWDICSFIWCGHNKHSFVGAKCTK